MPATLTPGKATMGTYSGFPPPTTTRPPCHTRYYYANHAATLPFVTPPICSRCNRALCTAARVGFSTRERKSLIGSPFFLAVLWRASVTALGLHIPQSFPIFCCQYRYAQHHISLSGYIRHVWSVCFYNRIFFPRSFLVRIPGLHDLPSPLSLSLSVSVEIFRYIPPSVILRKNALAYIFVDSFFLICF